MAARGRMGVLVRLRLGDLLHALCQLLPRDRAVLEEQRLEAEQPALVIGPAVVGLLVFGFPCGDPRDQLGPEVLPVADLA